MEGMETLGVELSRIEKEEQAKERIEVRTSSGFTLFRRQFVLASLARGLGTLGHQRQLDPARRSTRIRSSEWVVLETVSTMWKDD